MSLSFFLFLANKPTYLQLQSAFISVSLPALLIVEDAILLYYHVCHLQKLVKSTQLNVRYHKSCIFFNFYAMNALSCRVHVMKCHNLM